MKTYFSFLLFLLSFLFFLPLVNFAQEFVKATSGNFEWRLIGRVFFDGGVLTADSTTTSFQVNDIRLGVAARFMENWEAKVELGYGDSKISLKDIYLNYEQNNHSFRLGLHYEPFGNARVGTTNFRFMTNASSDKALGNKRKLGLSYSYNRKWLNLMAGIFSDGDVEKSKSLNQGYALAAKVVGRPWMKEKRLLHLGLAPRFSSSSDEFTFTAGAPTDLLAKNDNIIVQSVVGRVTNQWKLDAELIALYDKWYLQGQYFLVHLNRFGTKNYNAKAGYIQAGYMILGAKHNYNAKTGMIVNPAPKSLEVLVRYDNVNLNNAGIRGGRMSDISLGMNYFINKFIAAKINYTHMMPGKTALSVTDDYDVFQARIQFSF